MVGALAIWLLWVVGSHRRQRTVVAAALARELRERKLIEAELSNREEVFRRAFDDALVGMCLTDLDGHFLRVNAGFAEILGRAVGDLIGWHSADVTHPDDVVDAHEDAQRAIAGEIEAFSATKRYVRPDGSIVHVDLSTALIRDGAGRPLHFATQTIDVSGRHRAQSERDTHLGMLKSVIANSQSLIYVKDLDGRYLLANKLFEQAFSVAEADLLGKDDTYLDPDLAPVWRVNDLRAQEGEYRVEEWSDGKEGRCYYDSVKVPLFDGDGVMYAICGISLDVTERRKVNVELRAAAQATEEAAQAAIESTDAKSAFLAMISHEIRTPMNAVIGMTGLLLDTHLDAQQRNFAETVRGSGEALLTIINDILDFSKIEAGDLKLEDHRFELRDCVESAVALVALPAGAKGLELVVLVDERCPSLVIGDEARFRQIIVTLLGNAVKFTERGEVVVEVTAAHQPEGGEGPFEVAVSVTDTGIGIPPDRLDRLFQAFSQVDASTTRTYGGTGLGLAISHRLAQALGGELHVRSEPGQGSTFSFTAVLHSAVDRRQPTPEHLINPLAGRTALVVDDNATHRRMLRLLMQGWDMTCLEAATPEAALRIVSDVATRVDVAVLDMHMLDMHMPEMNGLGLALAIRSLPARSGLPLILLTSLPERPLAQHQEMFSATLSKPITRKGLRDKLLAALVPIEAALLGVETAGGRREYDAPVLPGAPLRILVAEDNLVNQQVALLLLKQLGHRVDVVGNGLEAVESVRRIPYDVVFMDIQMPEMDGLRATQIIRAESPRPRGPAIVALTASAMLKDRAACIDAGMDDYLSKPVRLGDLAGALENVRTADATATGEHPAGAARSDSRLDSIMQRLHDMFSGLKASPEIEALRLKVMHGFLTDTPQLMAALDEHIAAGNAEAVAGVAHSLLGITGNMGADAMVGLCAALEEHARSGVLNDARSLLGDLRSEYLKIKPLVDALYGEHSVSELEWGPGA